jgi:hypothetical protein
MASTSTSSSFLSWYYYHGRSMNPPDARAYYINTKRNQRVKFVLFTKILFRLLEQSEETVLRNNARRLVSSIVRKSRMGDPSCSPLFESLERHLRTLVGEMHWRRAHGYMRYYVAQYREILLPPKNLHRKISSHAA